jgi:HSP20 family protein
MVRRRKPARLDVYAARVTGRKPPSIIRLGIPGSFSKEVEAIAIVGWNPWNELSSLHSQMDRLFSDSLGEMTDRLGSDSASVPVDVRQTEDQLSIVASVPGFKPEDVEVTVDGGVLTIRGHYQEDVNGNEGQWVRRDRRMSSTYRQLVLPAEVQVDKIAAAFEHGVLTVTVPRAQKAQPKRIPVSTPSAATSQRVIDAPKQGPKS